MAAHGNSSITITDPGPVGFGPALRTGAMAAAGLGAILWLASLALAEPLRAWQAFLMAYFIFLMFGLGGMVITAIQYAASARWSIVVRRLAEGLSAFVYIAGPAMFLAIMFFGWNGLYGDAIDEAGLALTKGIYMTWPFVFVRGIVFYAIWIWFIHRIRSNSLEGDRTKDPGLHKRNVRLSIGFLILFAYTFSLHCIDMIMALHPRWFSTIFGVYCFAGLFLSTMCLLTLVVHFMRRTSPVMRDAIQPRHLYDLGTWIMAYSCFMCYIGFSQYMLLWYANLPETNFYFIIRTTNGWEYVTLLLPLLKWVVPFLVLMPQAFRANPRIQVGVCAAVILGQIIDVYWMIYPAFNDGMFTAPGIAEAGALLAGLGIFVLVVDRVYSRVSALPIGDPHLKSSITGSYL